MHRREVLGLAGSLAAAGLAGCVGGESGSEPSETPTDDSAGETPTGGDPTNTPTEAETAPPTEHPTEGATDTATKTTGTDGGLAVVARAFTVTEARCASGDGERVTVGVDGRTVTVTGTIRGDDLGHTAQLADVAVRGEDLVVTVESVDASGETEAAAQCIAAIGYEARIELSGAPAGVRVRHRSDGTTTTVGTAEA